LRKDSVQGGQGSTSGCRAIEEEEEEEEERQCLMKFYISDSRNTMQLYYCLMLTPLQAGVTST
jgi:hypothetical protein